MEMYHNVTSNQYCAISIFCVQPNNQADKYHLADSKNSVWSNTQKMHICVRIRT